jgi:hypothetical protein
MTKRLVPISDLAAYAADPEGFVERAGRAANQAAAQYGKAFHESFARDTVRPELRVPRALIAAVVLLLLVLLVARALR